MNTHHSIANAADYSANANHCITVSSSLNDSSWGCISGHVPFPKQDLPTNNHDERAPERRRLATPLLAVEQNDNGSQEASNLVDSNGESL